jgi:hypothetical protein
LGHKHSEIIYGTFAGQDLHRRPVPNQSEPSYATRRPGYGSQGLHRSICDQEIGCSQRLFESPRPDGSMHRGSSYGSITYETDSVVPNVLLETELSRLASSSSNKSTLSSASPMVVGGQQYFQGSPSRGGRPSDYFDYGLELPRVGSSPRESICSGTLEGSPTEVAYKPTGVRNSDIVMLPFSKPVDRQEGISQIRQYDSSSIHKQSGGYPINQSMYGSMETLAMGRETQSDIQGSTYQGRIELPSRQVIQANANGNRVEPQCENIQGNFCPVGSTSNRPVCDRPKQTSRPILLQRTGAGGVSCRRTRHGLEHVRRVRFSPDITDTSSSRQNREVPMCSDSDSPVLATEGLVLETLGPPSGGTDTATQLPRSATAVARGGLAPGPRQISDDGLEVERRRLLQEGFSAEVVETIQCSIRNSTKEVYNRQWKIYRDWCDQRSIDPCTASVSQVCAFLQTLLIKKAAYRTIAVYRSTISKYHIEIDGKPIGQNPRVCRFLKGVFHKNPPVRSLVPSWDLDIVLRALEKAPFEPMRLASIKHWTFKTIFLVAMTTARRCSTLSALCRREPYMRYEAGGIRIRPVPEFLTKTATPFHLGQDIILPELTKDDKKLCVKRAVKYYIKLTEKVIKKTETRLFVAFGGKSKGKAVANQTVSKWLVKTVKLAYKLAGKKVPNLKGHSTRGMAASVALHGGASILEVMKAADWRSTNTFARHYGLNLWKNREGKFGRAVLTSKRN